MSAILLWLTRAAHQTSDSLSYAEAAERGSGLFHPHHLLFTPIVRVIFRLSSSLVPSCDAVCAAQLHNVFWAVITVACVLVVVRELCGSEVAALISATLLLVSRSFWEFSTQAEVYVAATGAQSVLMALFVCRPQFCFSVPGRIVTGLLLALAIFYHQSSILFTAPAAYILLTSRGRPGFGAAATVVGTAGIVTLGGYVAAIHSLYGRVDVQTLVRFAFDYAYFPEPGWGTWHHFGVDGVRKLLFSQLESFVYVPEHLAKMSNRLWAAGLLGLVVWSLMRAAGNGAQRSIRGALVLWVAVNFVFFLWWLPGEKEFFITTCVPLIVLGAQAAAEIPHTVLGRRFVRSALIGMAAVITLAVFTVNLGGTILPLHRSRGWAYADAAALVASSGAECLILTDRDTQMSLRYYFKRDRVANLRIVLLRYYQHQPVMELYDWQGSPCVLATWWELAPGYDLGGTDGYRQRSEWQKIIEWLFALEFDAHHRAVRGRRFSVERLATGATYLSVGADKVPLDGLEELFHELDRQTSDTQFGSWAADLPGRDS